MGAVEVGRADLRELHPELAVQEARERDLELRVREEEDAPAGQPLPCPGQRARRTLAPRAHRVGEPRRRHAPLGGGGAQPLRGALGTERERRRKVARAARGQRLHRVGEERLGQQHARLGAHRRQLPGAARGQEAHRADPELLEQAGELVLDDVGQRTDHQQLAPAGHGQLGHQGREAGVLALRERRLDAAAGVVEHPHLRQVGPGQALGGPLQVELDDLRRTRPDQKQQLDVGPARQQLSDDPVELVVGVGQPGQVAVVDDGRGEARLGEDHHAGRRLQQVRAGARAHDEEEGVLDLAVQPDDAGETAEHLALAALVHDGQLAGLDGHRLDRERAVVHAVSPGIGAAARRAASSRRAARSLARNCAALIAYAA
jgi:hypothetical protein